MLLFTRATQALQPVFSYLHHPTLDPIPGYLPGAPRLHSGAGASGAIGTGRLGELVSSDRASVFKQGVTHR